jgi:hypothetical protein
MMKVVKVSNRSWDKCVCVYLYIVFVETSGRRISDLSRPLAQEKFSIFYMSTYQTDFVLVKKKKKKKKKIKIKLGYSYESWW